VTVKKIGLKNTGKCVGVNVDVNPCVEPRHVLHERPIFQETNVTESGRPL